MPRGADVLARRLAEAGCRHAFGIPGGEILTLMDSLDKAGVRFHLCKHENAGGFMAEGTYHATGAPAVLLATVGPGVANAVNTIANAMQDQVPLIFLTGCVDAADTHTYTHQIFDHRAVLEPICKASFTLVPDAVDVIIDKAVAIAADDRPGPVHIDVPIRVADAMVTSTRSIRRVRPSPMRPADTPAFTQVRASLAGAEKPLMICGLDVLHHDASRDVRDFLSEFPMPVITTYKAKGVVPEDDPNSIGAAGLSPMADEILLPLVKEADFILLAGYDPIEMRAGWRDPWGPDADVIEFSAVANTHYVHQTTASFIGHVGAGLRCLRREAERVRETWPDGEPAAARKKLRELFASGGAWGPNAVLESVRKTLPRDGVATCDTGAHRIVFSQIWEAYEPGSVLESVGLCTMGVALPIAIGHKLAKPETPIVAITGDAGLEMVLGELATARDMKLALPIVVLVDESLALIEIKQRREKLNNLGVDFGGTDFAKAAEAMGGEGVVADTPRKLENAIAKALAADGFTVIACPIGREAYDGKF